MASGPPAAGRLGYIDWARGFCVVLMLHTHAFYAWVRPEARGDEIFKKTLLVGGYPGAIFLFLSGLVLALATESRARRGSPGRDRVREGVKRGLEVLGFAFLFRLWMLVSGHFGRPADFLRVDVLNCIGASLALVAALTFGWTSARARIAAAFAVAAAFSLLAPLTWDWWLTGLPDPIRGYFSGRPRDALFPLFPWGGFTAAGAAAGMLLAGARQQGREGPFVMALGASGILLAAAGLLIDRFGVSIYPREDFWYTSPSYFLFKVGVVLVVLGMAFLADRIPGLSPLRQMGRTSLLIYWVHLEIVYGLYVIPGLRNRLDVRQALLGVALLTLAMLGLSLLRTYGPRWWETRRGRVLASA
jgi:uncharacterized membrane protein